MLHKKLKKITNNLFHEIKDYFNSKKDEDYLAFDNHPLSDLDSLLNNTKPAPWDHLNNSEDDEDIDIEIKEESLWLLLTGLV